MKWLCACVWFWVSPSETSSLNYSARAQKISSVCECLSAVRDGRPPPVSARLHQLSGSTVSTPHPADLLWGLFPG